jgi:uncharacterized protein YciI
MIRFLAVFRGQIEPSAQPTALTDGHFAWLRENADRITDFGGLRPASGGAFCGAAWVIQAVDEADARALIAGDPYFSEGLWQSSELFIWKSAHPSAVKSTSESEKTT